MVSYPKHIQFPTISKISTVSAKMSLVGVKIPSLKKGAKETPLICEFCYPFMYVKSKNYNCCWPLVAFPLQERLLHQRATMLLLTIMPVLLNYKFRRKTHV